MSLLHLFQGPDPETVVKVELIPKNDCFVFVLGWWSITI